MVPEAAILRFVVSAELTGRKGERSSVGAVAAGGAERRCYVGEVPGLSAATIRSEGSTDVGGVQSIAGLR